MSSEQEIEIKRVSWLLAIYNENTGMIILSLFGFLITFLVYFILKFIVSGLFYKVNLRTGSPQFETIYIAYKFHKSSYKKNAYQAILNTSRIGSLQSNQMIGIYYDDPKKVNKNNFNPVYFNFFLYFSIFIF